MEYAITDIETTGGYASGNSITEICVYVHNGKEVVQTFHSLVRPSAAIPRYISGLTGITEEMVAKAPAFNEIAENIYTLLNGRVFTAHNVNFDYSFLKKQLADCGYEWQTKKLCTMRLSRKMYPGLPSYSLSGICGYHSINIPDRHRAGGDVNATLQLFERMLQADNEGIIEQFIKRNSKENRLPPNLPKAEFDALPAEPGVYYFINRKGKVVYVGKAKNLKKRVNSHFSNNSASAQKQHFMREIYHIRFVVCEDEEAALTLETQEIKKLWPLFNRAQKRYEPLFGIVSYEDQTGFSRMALKKLRSKQETDIHVSSILEGQDLLRQTASEHHLCLRLSGIPVNREHCTEINCICGKKSKRSIKSYNRKVKEALMQLVNN
jgi:DNA polymerase-3 subunit epsilon